ncbi:MAG: hypothetical protein ACE5NN_00195 [Candidatus Bathyarchaeia archaeon]
MAVKEALATLRQLELEVKELEELSSKILNFEVMLSSVFQVLTYEETPMITRTKGKLITRAIKSVGELHDDCLGIKERLESRINRVIRLLEV